MTIKEKIEKLMTETHTNVEIVKRGLEKEKDNPFGNLWAESLNSLHRLEWLIERLFEDKVNQAKTLTNLQSAQLKLKQKLSRIPRKHLKGMIQTTQQAAKNVTRIIERLDEN